MNVVFVYEKSTFANLNVLNWHNVFSYQCKPVIFNQFVHVCFSFSQIDMRLSFPFFNFFSVFLLSVTKSNLNQMCLTVDHMHSDCRALLD